MTDKITHHELTAEWVNDNQGRAIMLTQPNDSFDDPCSVLIHPWQLRAVCEEFGIIASDAQAAKTIATLTRRMLVLRDRIDRLHNFLLNHSDHKHADLSYELTYATATADVADEFCAALDATDQPNPKPPQNPVGSKPVSKRMPVETHGDKQASLIEQE